MKRGLVDYPKGSNGLIIITANICRWNAAGNVKWAECQKVGFTVAIIGRDLYLRVRIYIWDTKT